MNYRFYLRHRLNHAAMNSWSPTFGLLKESGVFLSSSVRRLSFMPPPTSMCP